jgi:hypothetical protein
MPLCVTGCLKRLHQLQRILSVKDTDVAKRRRRGRTAIRMSDGRLPREKSDPYARLTVLPPREDANNWTHSADPFETERV